MTEQQYKAMKNAAASVRMEGFEVTEEMEKDCIRVMNGKISMAELLEEIVNKAKKRSEMTYSLDSVSDHCYPSTGSIIYNKFRI